MFIGETLGTFQLNDQHIFHKKISKVLAHALALVGNWKGDLSPHPKTSKSKLVDQSTLIDLLQESRTQSVGHLKNRTKDLLSQSIEISVFICCAKPSLADLVRCKELTM
jgi:hypothetical protein